MRSPTILIVSSLLFALSHQLLCVPKEVNDAQHSGAEGRVTLSVVDSEGDPVEGAKINVAFWPSDSVRDIVVIDGESDNRGLFSATGKTRQDMDYTIAKDGYYTTTGRFRFYPGDGRSVQDGKWRPWNPTHAVILKEKRKPIPMYAKKFDGPVPVQNAPVWFDLQKGDWVAPHGTGVVNDIAFEYRAEFNGRLVFKKKLSITFSNARDGLMSLSKDKTSKLVSRYLSPDSGYVKSITLSEERTETRIEIIKELKEDQYFAIRVRTVVDKEGKTVSSHYGKIYGPIEYGFGLERNCVRFSYHFNPVENDRNIEFDPSRNLFGRLRRGAVSQP